MMRLLPKTLFGQLTLTLISGLLLAQIVSIAIHLYDRGITVHHMIGHQMAVRVTGVVHLLNSQPTQERATVIQAFSSPLIRLHISDTPLKTSTDNDFDWRESRLRSHIESQFATPPQVRVSIRPSSPPSEADVLQRPRHRPPHNHPGGMPPPMRGRFGPDRPGGAGFAFTHVIQVQLNSGDWAIFEQRLPDSLSQRPYRLLISLLFLVTTIIAIAWWVVHRLTRPLNDLAHAADRLGRDIESEPLTEKGPQEVQRAAHAFNTMQQRIRRFIQDRSQFLSAVSHDLKTPLTRMRLRAETIPDKKMQEKFNQDVSEMEAMVSATLDFMRGLDSRETPQPVDINALLESLCDDYQENGCPIKISGHIENPYLARPLALKRALENIISNAVKYGTTPEVHLSSNEHELRLSITDKGPGIPERELERVFDPFFRLESSRNRDTGGTGLGLGIARNIIRGHGGDIILKNRAGGGLNVTITLPS